MLGPEVLIAMYRMYRAETYAEKHKIYEDTLAKLNGTYKYSCAENMLFNIK